MWNWPHRQHLAVGTQHVMGLDLGEHYSPLGFDNIPQTRFNGIGSEATLGGIRFSGLPAFTGLDVGGYVPPVFNVRVESTRANRRATEIRH